MQGIKAAKYSLRYLFSVSPIPINSKCLSKAAFCINCIGPSFDTENSPYHVSILFPLLYASSRLNPKHDLNI